MEQRIASVLAALYLRGLGRAQDSPRRRWPLVDHALRVSSAFCAGGCPAEVLAEAGLWFEASVLPTTLEEASALVASGRSITVGQSAYPQRWRELGVAAPPALWQRGSPCFLEGSPSFFTVVGSRSIDSRTREVARAAGREIARSGGVVVSGAAAGCDREAASGARSWARKAGVAAPVLEVLPHGISYGLSRLAPYSRPVPMAGVQLAVAAPQEGFYATLAMERNALLYAASERSLVVACRFREGGTWAGAVDALRRRLGSIWVWQDGSAGARALAALGAVPVRSLDAFLAGEVAERSLFG